MLWVFLFPAAMLQSNKNWPRNQARWHWKGLRLEMFELISCSRISKICVDHVRETWKKKTTLTSVKELNSWWTKTMPVCWIHLNYILISESMNISKGNPLVNLARHWDSKPGGMCRLHSGRVAQREISRPTWTWNNMIVEASTSPWWKLACLRIRVEIQFGSFFLSLSSCFCFSSLWSFGDCTSFRVSFFLARAAGPALGDFVFQIPTQKAVGAGVKSCCCKRLFCRATRRSQMNLQQLLYIYSTKQYIAI